MAKFRVIERVEGYYEYEMPITEEEVGRLNNHLTKVYGDFEPLTLEDIFDILEDNYDNPRCEETHIITYGDGRSYNSYLSSDVYDFFADEAWEYQVGDVEITDTLDVDRRVVR